MSLVDAALRAQEQRELEADPVSPPTCCLVCGAKLGRHPHAGRPRETCSARCRGRRRRKSRPAQQLSLFSTLPAPGLLELKKSRTPGRCLFCAQPAPRSRQMLCGAQACRVAWRRNWAADYYAGRRQRARQLPLVGGGLT